MEFPGEGPTDAKHGPSGTNRVPIITLLGANVVSSVGSNITMLAVPLVCP
jgi:hypothetical protein